MLIDEAVNETLNYIRSRGFSQNTVEWYTMALKQFKKYVTDEGVDHVEDVQFKMLNDYIEYTCSRPRLDDKPGRVSASTVNAHIKSIRGMFNYLQLAGKIQFNPAVKVKYLKKKQTVIVGFFNEQVKAMVSVIPDTFAGRRNKLLIRVLLDCGLRISEALEIRVGDIYFEQKLLKVFGKGQKERLVPFGEKTEKELRNWIAAHSLSDSDRIFFSQYHRTLTTAAVRSFLREYGRGAEIKGVRVSPHTFRHTFAIMFLRNGGNPFVLQRILGHSTLEMTKRYVNLFVEDLQREHALYGPGDRFNF
ncbi:MAG TPA: tyrosine-type recombinase/integrase [Bacillota bacterium]|nr:tyrosine-type recombinase/integrase [Bacillota bacterium]